MIKDVTLLAGGIIVSLIFPKIFLIIFHLDFGFCAGVDVRYKFLPRGLFGIFYCSLSLSLVQVFISWMQFKFVESCLIAFLHSSSNHGLLYLEDLGSDFGTVC